MSDYTFLTTWKFEASISRVWKEIEDANSWPEWWRGVLKVVELHPGEPTGLGSIRRTTWKSALPYKLEFDSEVVRIEHERSIEARAFGELEGQGIWHFTALAENSTRVDYDWRVKTTKQWMITLAPVARPIFKWNHDVIMRWGESGLRKRLQTPIADQAS